VPRPPQSAGYQAQNAVPRPPQSAGYQAQNANAVPRPTVVAVQTQGMYNLSLTPASQPVVGCWDPVASPVLQMIVGRAVLSAIRDTGHFRMYARNHSGNH